MKIARIVFHGSVVVTLLLIVVISDTFPQQLVIPRIDQMPNRPSPYLMRNWKQVAVGYDSLVFNFDLTGTYLPLVWLNTNPDNYPETNSFGLHTVVGTTVPGSAEAINCLPAVIGATLSGVDKSNQNGYNWALMCQEWFNKRPSQNVYKNHPVDDMGDDWWYETMPNVFFYQLNCLYPGTGDFNYQFTTVADRWLQAVQTMGGSATPWRLPNMDHRGWYLQTMMPYDGDVHEPEAAGAIGWLLYNAWMRTGSIKYLQGAEWAMEFLNGLSSNPAYELQLSYGTYLAARMNAEIGTSYDVEKMVNWCFNVGPLRSWGSVVGNWGGNDCSGLIGEVNNNNDYAFAMNTFEQIGALVPIVRYDDRFARAIGKWVLNATNAARLFYPNFLPDNHQDSYQWAHQYDTNSYIAHEAMRESQSGFSPFATGDAISGGWGNTTLALYGSSHVGILGGIIDTTDVQMILKLDVLKTDYNHAPAYPSYLFFNPYDTAKIVTLDVGSGLHDLYDAVTNSFLQTGVSGISSVSIPADAAVLVVVTPSSGTITYNLDQMLIGDVVVDYHSGQFVGNYPPRIKSLTASRDTVLRKDSVTVYCTAMDKDGDTLSYSWQVSNGTVIGSGQTIRWVAPDTEAACTIICIVSDGHNGQDTANIIVNVVTTINHPPVIMRLIANPRKLNLGASSQLTCIATDQDGDTLKFTWSSSQGTFAGTDSSVAWTAPDVAGNCYIRCEVSDGQDGQGIDSIGLEVRDFSQQQTGQLVVYYPFDGNANDSSGFNNNGTVHGATLVSDRKGNPNSAYSFNGSSSYILVPNSSSLNFQQSTTINFWMKIGVFYDREQHPISHGSWQNRWKVSISDKHLRWTIKTNVGTKDLDSEIQLLTNTYYNVTVLYDGSDMEVWLNGALDAFTTWSGSILTTSIDLTIGQVLPGDQGYNFNGVLDDIRIYNYGLSMQDIQDLSGITSVAEDQNPHQIPTDYELNQNYPNPFNPTTTFEIGIPRYEIVSLKVYDMLGREVTTLFHEMKHPGRYSIQWDASNMPSGVYFYKLITPSIQLTRKLILLR
jgi:hypothetical protein